MLLTYSNFLKNLRITTIFLFFFTFSFFPQKVFAGDIVINEIMYDLSGTDTDREWIEIYNKGTSSVDLTDWRFKEGGTNHTLIVYQGGLTLNAGSFAIVVDNPTVFLNDHSGFSGIIIDSSFSLSNTGETLTLLESDISTVSDEVAYQSSWGAAGTGGSLERKSSTGGSNDSGNWQESISSGTPGSANSAGATPSPTPTPTSTSSPSPIPTSTPTPKPATPKPSVSSTTTPTPSPTILPIPTKIVVGVEEESLNSSEILGTSSAMPTPKESIKPQVKKPGENENIFQKVFIILGILTIITSVGIFIRQKWIKQ